MHDNATVHRSAKIQHVVQEFRFVGVDDFPYSSDLAAFDFYLFRLLKKHLRGRRFKSDECLKEAVYHFFDDQKEIFFFKGINSLESKWGKCIYVGGDYIEK